MSILIGTGLTQAVCQVANVSSSSMAKADFEEFDDKISEYAQTTAIKMGRDNPNIEDQIRTSFQLLEGYKILGDTKNEINLERIINDVLFKFTKSIADSEKDFINKLERNDVKAQLALNLLTSFLLTFSSRNATRDRLHIFTTNYDRFIEYACDNASIKIIDRFFGKIQPTYQETLPNIDYYYKTPDTKNEFRYAEGVVRYTKIHGSIDWISKNNKIIQSCIPFGCGDIASKLCDLQKNLMIYPNSMKSIETAYYPYSQLFRDFSTAICRQNSSLVVYGYGFGDSHINKILIEMLQIPSAHLVIISYTIDDRLINFLESVNADQITLLCGPDIAALDKLVTNYLPISAIDNITERVADLMKRREIPGLVSSDTDKLSDSNNQELTLNLDANQGKVMCDDEVVTNEI